MYQSKYKDGENIDQLMPSSFDEMYMKIIESVYEVQNDPNDYPVYEDYVGLKLITTEKEIAEAFAFLSRYVANIKKDGSIMFKIYFVDDEIKGSMDANIYNVDYYNFQQVMANMIAKYNLNDADIIASYLHFILDKGGLDFLQRLLFSPNDPLFDQTVKTQVKTVLRNAIYALVHDKSLNFGTYKVPKFFKKQPDPVIFYNEERKPFYNTKDYGWIITQDTLTNRPSMCFGYNNRYHVGQLFDVLNAMYYLFERYHNL